MKINLSQLNNDEVVSYIDEQIAQYEQEKEQSKTTGYAVYNGVSLADFQQYDKHIQRCLMYGTNGAVATRDKVKQILANDAGIGVTREDNILSLYECHQKQGTAHRFFENGKR